MNVVKGILESACSKNHNHFRYDKEDTETETAQKPNDKLSKKLERGTVKL